MVQARKKDLELESGLGLGPLPAAVPLISLTFAVTYNIYPLYSLFCDIFNYETIHFGHVDLFRKFN